ncbi:restriction endonuclease [Micromonospora chersina]|uniref:restriction endonuclease n=1 Tax=Micromonospora chersina TaxID=47854 RepID=UPI0037120CBA
MLVDSEKWRSLVAEYAELRRPNSGMTRQARGQRFNSMIAELLTAFGLRAQSDVRSVGELDVVFTYLGRRFILEAKWEQTKTSTGPVAKLQRRVEQRMAGVTGVFLAMKGFTDDAVDEIDKGRRLDVLLLDQTHWEAMLSGFVPPQELFDLVTDAASFHGRAYTPLADLLRQRPNRPEVVYRTRGKVTDIWLRAGAVSLAGEADPRREGMGSAGGSTALVTLTQGVLGVNLVKKRADWVVPLSGCSRTSVALADGSVLVTRGHGVGRYSKDGLSVLSSGATNVDDSELLVGPDGSTWCLERGGAGTTPARLIRVGARVGDETWHKLPVAAVAAAWLTPARLVLSDGADLLVLTPRFTLEQRLPGPAGGVRGLTALNERRVITLTDDLTLVMSDLKTRQHIKVGSLTGIVDVAGGLAHRTGDSVLVFGWSGGADRHLVVAEVEIPGDRLRGDDVSPETTSRDPGANVNDDGAGAEPAQATAEPVARVIAAARAAPVPAARASVEPPLVSGPDLRGAEAWSAEKRLAEQRRGHADGLAMASALPLYAMEGLVGSNFEIAPWLKPWREQWDRIASAPLGSGGTMGEWLPTLARLLGSYAAPSRVSEAQFTPSGPYVLGFADGLRAGWQDAVRSRLVPPDAPTLGSWIRDAPQQGGLPLALHTIADLRGAAQRARRRTTWTWVGRALLWLLTFLFGLFEVGAIAITIGGDWQPNTVTSAVIGNACFGIPFVGLLWLTVRDLKRLADGGRAQPQEDAQAHAFQAERSSSVAEGAGATAQPESERQSREQLGWVASRPDRGNPPGEYAAFSANSGLYWTLVGLNSVLIVLLAIAIPTTDIPLLAKVGLGLAGAFLIFLTIGFGKMASNPTRLEIGREGIQVFSRSGTVWFPWHVLNRVEVMRLEGGTLHLVGWCENAELFPDSDGFGGGPRFLPSLKAVGICPLSILHTRRHLVVRALQTYGGNRYGRL